MQLSKRLLTIVDQLQGNCLADIGCDHGYVCIAAIQQNKVKKAYACDIASKPLERARYNVHQAKLEGKIYCMLMDGIQSLPEEVDCVIIAGMGATLMIDILERGKMMINEGTRFYFSPHKDTHDLRAYLNNSGFSIVQERFVFEEHHFYPVIEAVYTDKRSDDLLPVEKLYGVNVLYDATYRKYLEHEYVKWERIYRQIPKEKSTEAHSRLYLLNGLLDHR